MKVPSLFNSLLHRGAAVALAVLILLQGGHRPAAAHGDEGAGHGVHGAAGAALDAYLQRLAAFGYSGSVLVARRGEVLLDAGYGRADEETGEPYQAGTLFDIASVSKQFTAAAVLALEMAGRLRVEDPLSRFFSNVPPDKAAITLHQLLTHTSGLPDVVGPEYEPISRDQMLRRLFAAPLLLPPGKRFRYSNAGYSLLAAVVEVASGRPLGDFMRERLFLPAGMRHTGFRLPLWERRPLAHAYRLDGPWGTPLDHPWAPDGPWWNLRGNGGVLSTTGDLYRWDQALAGDKVLSRAEREKLQSPHVSEGRHTPSHYAYGWSITSGPTGSRLASHTGSNGAFETDFRRYLDDRSVIIASSNRADFSAVSIAPHLENRLFGLPDPEPPAAVRLPLAQLRRCAGSYLLPTGERLWVDAARGGLLVAPEGPAGLALLLSDQGAEERELMAGRTQEVADALAGMKRGDPAPLGALFGLPDAEAERPFRAALRSFGSRLGAWTGGTVLGSASLGGYPYTYARLTFERGATLAEYRWEGPTAEKVRYLERPAPHLFLPERSGDGGLTFGTYDVRTGAVQHLRIDLPPQGDALSLVLETPGGEVSALWAGGGPRQPND